MTCKDENSRMKTRDGVGNDGVGNDGVWSGEGET